MWEDIDTRDLNLRDSYYLLLYRASIFRGKITDIKLPAELPPDSYIISYDDLAHKEIEIMGNKIPILCDGYVNYQGEPILIIASKTKTEAEKIHSQIKVEYAPSTPLFFEGEITEEQVIKEKEITWTYDDKPIDTENTIKVETETFGEGFKPIYNDQVGIAIHIGEKVTACTSTLWPYSIKEILSDIMDVPKDDVTVRLPEIASPFEGRLGLPSILASLAGSAAAHIKKSVRLILSKEETQLFMGAQYPFKIKHSSVVEKETGRILQCDVSVDINTGVYPILIDEVLESALNGVFGPYKVNKVNIKERLIRTSFPPMFFISSTKFTNMLVGIENHITDILAETELLPDEWRIENMTDEAAKSGHIVIEKSVKNSDFERKYSAYELAKRTNSNYLRGIGLAFASYRTTSGFSDKVCTPYTGTLILDDNWQLHYSTATVPQNFLDYKVWKEVISRETQLDIDSIRILPHDTDINPDSIPDILGEMSKGSVQLVRKCCKKLQELRVSSPLPIIVKENYNTAVDVHSIAWGAAIVEVSIDKTTYKPKIKGIWTCFDIGDIVDEDTTKRYITQRILDSLYWCNDYNDSEFSPWSFASKPISISLINSQGTKDVNYVGDLPIAIIPAAFCSAVNQAIGKNIYTLPVTPEKIYRMMEGQ